MFPRADFEGRKRDLWNIGENCFCTMGPVPRNYHLREEITVRNNNCLLS